MGRRRRRTPESGVFQSMRAIVDENGGDVMSLYQGWRAFVVLAWKPALENAVFDAVKQRILRLRKSGLSAMEAFVLGLVARAICTLLTYPATRGLRIQQGYQKKKGGAAKQGRTKEETREGKRKEGTEKTLWQVLVQLYRKDGVVNGLYVGLLPDITRGVLSSAIRYSIKEQIQQFFQF